MFSTENLSVGDTVLVVYSEGVNKSKVEATITKKTPTGMVDVVRNKGYTQRFKSDGTLHAKKDPWSRLMVYLEEATPERLAELEKERKRVSMLNCVKSFDWSLVSDKELVSVIELINKYK